MKTSDNRYIYKIITNEVWTRAQTGNNVPPMPIDDMDGFIHFSTKDQLLETLRLYFSGHRDLQILVVRVSDISAALKWEPSRGGALFPHLYGPLKRADIAHHTSVDVDALGVCQLPEGFL